MSTLEQAVAKRSLSKIAAAAADPPRLFERLVGADEWKLRVGDRRVVAALAHDTKTVIVLRIDHRSRVHRR